MNPWDVRVEPKPPAIESGLSPLSLRLNFWWAFAGNVIYAGCQWGMIAVLAKLGSPTAVGRFALGLAVTAPVFMLANLQLRTIQATDASREHPFGQYLALRLMTTAAALIVVAAVVAWAGYHGETAAVIAVVAAAKACEAVSDVCYGLWQQKERLDFIAKSMTIRGLASLAGLAAGFLASGRVLGAALGMAAAWCGVLMAYDLRCCVMLLRKAHSAAGLSKEGWSSSFKPQWDFDRLKSLAKLALPLGVVMMLISLHTNIPRYLVEGFLGQGALGIFAAVAYTMTAGTTVVQALGQAASPRLALHFNQGRMKAFWRLLIRLLALVWLLWGLGLGLVLLAGRQILTVLYTPEYAAHVVVFACLTAASLVWDSGVILGYAATARRRIRVQPAALGAAVLILLASGAILIPKLGLLGAALSMGIGSVAAAAGLALVLCLPGPSGPRRARSVSG